MESCNRAANQNNTPDTFTLCMLGNSLGFCCWQEVEFRKLSHKNSNIQGRSPNVIML